MVLYLVCAAKEAAALVRYPGQAPLLKRSYLLHWADVLRRLPKTTADVIVVNNFDELNALGTRSDIRKVRLIQSTVRLR